MRDLKKDLEIIQAATPESWEVVKCRCHFSSGISADGTSYLGCTYDIYVIHAQGKEIARCGWKAQDKVNARFIAEAREGWPEAIRRAMEAEARVKELKNVLQLAYQALTNGMVDVVSGERDPKCSRLRVEVKRNIRRVLGVEEGENDA